MQSGHLKLQKPCNIEKIVLFDYGGSQIYQIALMYDNKSMWERGEGGNKRK